MAQSRCQSIKILMLFDFEAL